MQRYSMQIIGGAHAPEIDVSEDESGDWVRFADVQDWHLGRPVMSSPDMCLLVDLVARYTADPVPPCRVCGGELSIQACGGGMPTVWGCSGLEDDPGKPGFVRYIEGRRCADEHYARSKWTQYQRGDSDVLELCRRYCAHIDAIKGESQ
jgi:hypothetical protein